MDGIQTQLSASLQRRLFTRLSLAILGIALVAGTFCFISAFREAHEFQDEVLRQVADLFDTHAMDASSLARVTPTGNRDQEAHVFVQLLGSPPASPITDSEQPQFSGALQTGIQTAAVAQGSFRVYVATLRSGERLAVAQRTEVRDEIARHSALATLMPFLLLVPLLLLMTSNLIREMLRPITQLSADVDQRSEQQLHAIDSVSVPSEIRPLITAINRLLARVSHSMLAQRRFIADAAHELRSPMTALSLQAERLANAEMSPMARERLSMLRQGIERSRALLEQLLALARAQSPAPQRQETVSVHRVFRRVLEDLMPLAEAKNINIGVITETDVSVQANEADLVTLIRNLLDNAIRYTPAGGQVDLAASSASAMNVIEIIDTGPGIMPRERSRVFDPFYRVAGSPGMGSGLGLSIVATIAARASASVTLTHAQESTRTGLRVIVAFPHSPLDQQHPAYENTTRHDAGTGTQQ